MHELLIVLLCSIVRVTAVTKACFCKCVIMYQKYCMIGTCHSYCGRNVIIINYISKMCLVTNRKLYVNGMYNLNFHNLLFNGCRSQAVKGC